MEDGRVYVNGVQLPELIRFPPEGQYRYKGSQTERSWNGRGQGIRAQAERSGGDSVLHAAKDPHRPHPYSQMYRVGVHAGCGFMSLNASKYRRHLIRGAKSAQNQSKCG